MLKLLLGLYPPERGTITIGGRNVSDITDQERRICIGCVEQHFLCVPGTIREQITLGDPRITGEMAEKAARLAGIHTSIETLRMAMIRYARRGYFPRESGSCCPLPVPWQQIRLFFFWMRLQQIWTLRPKRVCWKR